MRSVDFGMTVRRAACENHRRANGQVHAQGSAEMPTDTPDPSEIRANDPSAPT